MLVFSSFDNSLNVINRDAVTLKNRICNAYNSLKGNDTRYLSGLIQNNYPTKMIRTFSIYKVKQAFSDQTIRITLRTLWNSLDTKLKCFKTAVSTLWIYVSDIFNSSLVVNHY